METGHKSLPLHLYGVWGSPAGEECYWRYGLFDCWHDADTFFAQVSRQQPDWDWVFGVYDFGRFSNSVHGASINFLDNSPSAK